MPNKSSLSITKVIGEEAKFFMPTHYGENHNLIMEKLRHAPLILTGENVRNFEFYKISNGGFFVSPVYEGELQVMSPYYDHVALSAECFGLVLTYNMFSFCFDIMTNKTTIDSLSKKRRLLKDYINTFDAKDIRKMKRCMIL